MMLFTVISTLRQGLMFPVRTTQWIYEYISKNEPQSKQNRDGINDIDDVKFQMETSKYSLDAFPAADCKIAVEGTDIDKLFLEKFTQKPSGVYTMNSYKKSKECGLTSFRESIKSCRGIEMASLMESKLVKPAGSAKVQEDIGLFGLPVCNGLNHLSSRGRIICIVKDTYAPDFVASPASGRESNLTTVHSSVLGSVYNVMSPRVYGSRVIVSSAPGPTVHPQVYSSLMCRQAISSDPIITPKYDQALIHFSSLNERDTASSNWTYYSSPDNTFSGLIGSKQICRSDVYYSSSQEDPTSSNWIYYSSYASSLKVTTSTNPCSAVSSLSQINSSCSTSVSQDSSSSSTSGRSISVIVPTSPICPYLPTSLQHISVRRMSIADFDIDRIGENLVILGSGTFGTAYKGKLVDTVAPVVIKMILTSGTPAEEVYKEAAITMHLHDTGIVPRVYGIAQFSANALYIVQECCEGQTLHYLLYHQFNTCSNYQWLTICYELTLGLISMHEKDVCHNDIKTNNIMVDIEGEIKIRYIDFGKATHRSNTASIFDPASFHKYPFLAPEIRFNYPTSKASDVYSLGFIFSQICQKGIPELGKVTNMCLKMFPWDRPSLVVIALELEDLLSQYNIP